VKSFTLLGIRFVAYGKRNRGDQQREGIKISRRNHPYKNKFGDTSKSCTDDLAGWVCQLCSLRLSLFIFVPFNQVVSIAMNIRDEWVDKNEWSCPVLAYSTTPFNRIVYAGCAESWTTSQLRIGKETVALSVLQLSDPR